MGRCSDARDRLLASAAKLLYERGYAGLSVADVCTDAGLKKGSFYYFFPSKHALVLAVVDRFAQRHSDRVEEALQAAKGFKERLVGMLRLVAHDLAARQQTDGCVRGCPLGNLALEMADRDESIRQKIVNVFDRWQIGLETVLNEAIACGDLALEHPEIVARSLVAYVEGAILLAKTNNDASMFETLEPGALAIVEGATRRPPSPRVPTPSV